MREKRRRGEAKGLLSYAYLLEVIGRDAGEVEPCGRRRERDDAECGEGDGPRRRRHVGVVGRRGEGSGTTLAAPPGAARAQSRAETEEEE